MEHAAVYPIGVDNMKIPSLPAEFRFDMGRIRKTMCVDEALSHIPINAIQLQQKKPQSADSPKSYKPRLYLFIFIIQKQLVIN